MRINEVMAIWGCGETRASKWLKKLEIPYTYIKTGGNGHPYRDYDSAMVEKCKNEVGVCKLGRPRSKKGKL